MDYDFPYLGNAIIPTDELIFFRGVGIPPTRISHSYPRCWDGDGKILYIYKYKLYIYIQNYIYIVIYYIYILLISEMLGIMNFLMG